MSLRPDPPSVLLRRNSVSSAAPPKLILPSKKHSSSFPIAGDKDPFPAGDFHLRPFPYTSLKDLLPYSPSGVQSPTAVSSQSCSDISIRNRLVKQAAWAYLQPMASSPDSVGRDFLRRMWAMFSGDFSSPVRACLVFVNDRVLPTIRRAFDRIRMVIWVGRKQKR